MSALPTRKGARTVIGLLTSLGLVAALTMPALAGAEGPLVEPRDEWPTDAQECWQVLDFASAEAWAAAGGKQFKPNGGNAPTAGDHDDGTLEVNIADLTANSFSWSSNIGVDAVYVKGGQGESQLYWYDTDGGPGEVTADSNLTTVDGGAISHIMFCYDLPDTPPSEAPESQAEESQAEESQAEESAEESVDEGVLGGNPTPTQGGTIPDTATGTVSTVPATVLSLVLLAAVGAMISVRLARQR